MGFLSGRMYLNVSPKGSANYFYTQNYRFAGYIGAAIGAAH